MTFSALDKALAPHGLRSFKPLLPRAQKSAIASYLEREPLLQAKEHWDTLDPLGGAGDFFPAPKQIIRLMTDEAFAPPFLRTIAGQFGPDP